MRSRSKRREILVVEVLRDWLRRAAGGTRRCGAVGASGGSRERGAGGVADLDGRRVAECRRRAAVSEGGAPVSARCGLRRGACVGRRNHRPPVGGREWVVRFWKRRSSGRAARGSGSSSCTCSRGTSRRFSCTSGSGSSVRATGRGITNVGMTLWTRCSWRTHSVLALSERADFRQDGLRPGERGNH
jgi:hypothetical protein